MGWVDMEKRTFQLIFLGIMDITIVICGFVIWKYNQQLGSVLAVTAIVLGLTTYFGFVAISQSQNKKWATNIGSMRTAITSSVLAIYFFILSVSILLQPEALGEFGKTMVNTFTTMVGIIIPFYFGASVYAQVHAPCINKEDGQEME